MKKKNSVLKVCAGIFACALVTFAIMAFQDSTKITSKAPPVIFDTVPKNSDIDINIKMDDIEKTINKSMEAVNKSLEEIDWNKISGQIEESLKKVNFEKIQEEIERSMKNIDWDKMQAEIDRSMKDIDKEKLKAEIEKEVSEATKNIKEINSVELKKELEKVKQEIEDNKGKMKVDIEKAMDEAKKAEGELSGIKEMRSEMEADGLISEKDGYNIEYHNKELFINGKKQSQEVTEKYRKYFKGENFKMKRDKGD